MPDSKQDLTMLIVGDVLVSRPDPSTALRHVRDFLRSGDIVLGNLEATIADTTGTPWPKSDKTANWTTGDARKFKTETLKKIQRDPILVKMKGRDVSILTDCAFSAVSVANNHSMDFGYEPLRETMERLAAAGIGHAGGGSDFASAHKPAIVEQGGCRVALLAYTSLSMPGWAAGPESPGVAVMHAYTAYQPPVRVLEVPGTPATIRTWAYPEDKEILAADIEAARKVADIVVASFHWGVSGKTMTVCDYQIEYGHHAIDAGADLVFGHHPHQIHGIEVYRGRPIFYSLGNFCVDYHDAGMETETFIVRCPHRG